MPTSARDLAEEICLTAQSTYPAGRWGHRPLRWRLQALSGKKCGDEKPSPAGKGGRAKPWRM